MPLMTDFLVYDTCNCYKKIVEKGLDYSIKKSHNKQNRESAEGYSNSIVRKNYRQVREKDLSQ